MRDEDIAIFINRANTTHWAKDFPEEILPFDDYYKVLFKPSTTIKKISGLFEKNNTSNKITIFKNSNNQTIAQVASYKKYNSQEEYTKNQTLPTAGVATYLNRFDRIILLNHFDAIGRNHSNDYSFYPKHLQPYYLKYFTDNTVEQNGEIYYHSNCPHFHFNSALQTKAFENQEHINAISIKQLLIYLNDLQNCTDENDILLNESFGMPFLTYYRQENKYQYVSVFGDVASKLYNVSSCENHGIEVKEYMKKVQHLIEISNPTTNLEKIMLDLHLLNKIIKKFPDNLELVAIFSNAFVKSINYKTYEKEIYKQNQKK